MGLYLYLGHTNLRKSSGLRGFYCIHSSNRSAALHTKRNTDFSVISGRLSTGGNERSCLKLHQSPTRLPRQAREERNILTRVQNELSDAATPAVEVGRTCCNYLY